MTGVSWKTRKRKLKRTPEKKVTSEAISFQATEETDPPPENDFAVKGQSSVSPLASTPKRGRREARRTRGAQLTSTPVHNSSTDTLPPSGAKQVELEYTELITQLKQSDLDSPCHKSEPRHRHKRGCAAQPRKVRKRMSKKQTKACGKASNPLVKGMRGRSQKINTEATKTHTVKCCRRRFQLEKSDAVEQADTKLPKTDSSSLSSELSIELSHHEQQLPPLNLQEDEESGEEEDELPSFLMQVDKKPPSITGGVFVWHKFRNFPFWPAWVKSVNRKQRKASIMFIDDTMIHKKKGFTVSLKTLKPFDGIEANELVCKAKEKHNAAIEWSLDLITDYRIKIACGPFSGSFIEYFDHNMSYPVRRKYPQAESERLTIASDEVIEVPGNNHEEDSVSEPQENVCRRSKRLLPDRSRAAHNRANEKLVHFIVKQRMVDGHLLAVIRGQQQSRWLRSFLSANRRRVVNIYLEDDQQLDQVYWYLSELYTTALATAPCLNEVKFVEQVPFVLDVLLPEAIIYAIAGVDRVSVKKAEEKYLKGRSISNRERQEFDLMIERQMKQKITAS